LDRKGKKTVEEFLIDCIQRMLKQRMSKCVNFISQLKTH